MPIEDVTRTRRCSADRDAITLKPDGEAFGAWGTGCDSGCTVGPK